MTADFDRVRILVLGDSGVGKTSLVHLISRGKPLSHITYTIGASVEVKLHEYKEGTPVQRTYWIGNLSKAFLILSEKLVFSAILTFFYELTPKLILLLMFLTNI